MAVYPITPVAPLTVLTSRKLPVLLELGPTGSRMNPAFPFIVPQGVTFGELIKLCGNGKLTNDETNRAPDTVVSVKVSVS